MSKKLNVVKMLFKIQLETKMDKKRSVENIQHPFSNKIKTNFKPQTLI